MFLVLHAGHLGYQRLRDLHGEHTHASGGSVDQDLPPRSNLPGVAKVPEGGGGCQGNSGSLLERELGRLGHEAVLTGAYELGEGACAPAEHLIPWSQPLHALPNRDNVPCDVGSSHADPWAPQPPERRRAR